MWIIKKVCAVFLQDPYARIFQCRALIAASRWEALSLKDIDRVITKRICAKNRAMVFVYAIALF